MRKVGGKSFEQGNGRIGGMRELQALQVAQIEAEIDDQVLFEGLDDNQSLHLYPHVQEIDFVLIQALNVGYGDLHVACVERMKVRSWSIY